MISDQEGQSVYEVSEMNDREELYALISSVFDRHPKGHIDHQSELSEKVQLIQTLCSEKPSFFAMTHDPERLVMYEDLSLELASLQIHQGHQELPVYFAGRTLKIPDDKVRDTFTKRLHFPQRIYWLTCQASVAKFYQSQKIHLVGEENLLGYPSCCRDWHFDCYLARGVEAFYDVFRRSTSVDDLTQFAETEWIPNSGWFLSSEIYLTGLLISEQRFPFLSHLACPKCRTTEDSPSAILNHSCRSIAQQVDAQAAEQVEQSVERLRKDLREKLGSIPRMIKQASSELRLPSLDNDVYERHCRYLAKALVLKI